MPESQSQPQYRIEDIATLLSSIGFTAAPDELRQIGKEYRRLEALKTPAPTPEDTTPNVAATFSAAGSSRAPVTALEVPASSLTSRENARTFARHTVVPVTTWPEDCADYTGTASTRQKIYLLLPNTPRYTRAAVATIVQRIGRQNSAALILFGGSDALSEEFRRQGRTFRVPISNQSGSSTTYVAGSTRQDQDQDQD